MISRALSLALLLATPIASGLAQGQIPAREPFYSAPAQTVWASKGQAVIRSQINRLSAAASRDLQARGTLMAPVGAQNVATLASQPLTGTLKEAVVGVSFPDNSLTESDAAINAHLYGAGSPSDYSISQYYTEVSRGVFSITGSVAGRTTLPHPASYYVGQRQGYSQTADSLPQFMLAVVRGADSTTDWTQYVDPQDPAHRVAALVVLYAGPGGTCSGSGDGQVYPHRYSLTKLTGSPYVTHSRTADGSPIVIDDYIVEGAENCQATALAPNGVLIHESGHLLGLPDLYNTSLPNGAGPVGDWDLISTGNYNTALMPSRPGAWSIAFFGWATVVPLGARDTTYRTTAINDGGTIGLIPEDFSSEFLLTELRDRHGTDQALHGEGFVFWAIDPDAITRGLADNTVNVDTAHYGVAVVQAQPRTTAYSGTDQGSAGDVWPGASGSTEFGPATTPAFVSRQTGRAAGYDISAIAVVPGVSGITGRFSVTGAHSPSPISPDTVIRAAQGARLSIQLSLKDTTGVGSDSLVWSGNQAALSRLGLTLSSTGLLSGVVNSTDTQVVIRVVVTSASSTSGSASLAQGDVTVHVAYPDGTSVAAVIAHLLDPSTGMSDSAIAYYDAVGNKNGMLDIGDLVIGVKTGQFALPPSTPPSIRNIILSH